jgi:pimeloyl-ACP methyl ester carboxylesterase
MRSVAGPPDSGEQGTELRVFPQSGHMTFADQPGLFLKTIGDFLR